MCRQYLTVYEWCRCEENAGNLICAPHEEHECPGVFTEAVHMHCFCHWHASKGWKTEHKLLKKHNKMSKKTQKRRSTLSEKSLTPKRWFSWTSLRSRNSI
ncbi:uncharacterized protein ASPGLDRAFT_46757 [Aspergillus glaucus CBS 516.65]|uniref:Uncharacterized protein n=1 Tax=Aspergillus glaucus CBS 516.65 TaxID=1160497 RepID=A0A1L9VLT8_ASPGL|nr:hypothetical protein ASPGLDRAFT_46757 [Aspergillus glaucus CBS 516.65]OJJ84840.1 hypothetical protein ASPGLDRAFT_46757 [Aspergillus glaucus CBS 516.65]